jgi:dTDP-4-dehydrorhamnose reductase
MKKLKILILGHKGMLGHMVKNYFESQKQKIETCNYRWPTKEMKNYIIHSNPDFIINCIGAIPQRKTTFKINYELPIWLDKYSKSQIIHPGTDCDDDDDYGNSKKRATNFIIKESNQTKIIKTSILGTELKGNASLLEWFLSQKGEVDGYSKAIWSGNTTLEWAKHCYDLTLNWDNYKVETVLQGETVSKYNLLKIISEVWGKKIKINKIPLGTDRSLLGDIKTSNIKSQLIELKSFNEKVFNSSISS